VRSILGYTEVAELECALSFFKLALVFEIYWNHFFFTLALIDKLRITEHATVHCKMALKFHTNINKIKHKLSSIVQVRSIHLLKGTFIWFPLEILLVRVPHKAPTVVRHHMTVPSTLVPCFHSLDGLVKSFTLFFAYFTNIIWKSTQVTEEVMKFYTHSCPSRVWKFVSICFIMFW